MGLGFFELGLGLFVWIWVSVCGSLAFLMGLSLFLWVWVSLFGSGYLCVGLFIFVGLCIFCLSVSVRYFLSVFYCVVCACFFLTST